MKRLSLALLLLALAVWPAYAQPVTVIGPITPGDCARFSSTTILKDAGFDCSGAGGGVVLGLSPTVVGDVAVWDNVTATLLAGSATVPATQFSAAATNPVLGLPSDSHALGFSITTNSANISPGFGAQVEGVENTFTYLHGEHSDASKTTASNEIWNFNGGGAGQKFDLILKQTCPGAGDCQTISINTSPFGGQQSSGDEGTCMFCGAVFPPTRNTPLTAAGNGVVGGGNSTTTQTITGNLAAQTVTVASSAGFTIGEWIIINGSATSPTNAEAVQLTGVAAGSIAGVFRLNQSSGVTVLPATVLAVSSTLNVGEHRYLIDDTLPAYTTGTVTFDPLGIGDATFTGSGTTFTNGMVGGNSSDVGCIAAATWGTGTRKFWDRITAVNSTTNLTGIATIASGFSVASAFTISPCAFVYRVIPNTTYGSAGTLVLETNAFAWTNGDTLEEAVGPNMSGVLAHFIDDISNTGWQTMGAVTGLAIDELGLYTMQDFIKLTNFGAYRPVSGSNQTSFLNGDTSANPGQIAFFLKSEKTAGLLWSTMNNGGQYFADAYGFGQFGLTENVNMLTVGLRVVGAGFELDPTWNNNSFHALIGGNITDTLSTAGSDLIKIQVGAVTKFEVRKDGAILSPTLVTPVLGVATGTSLALNGATLGNNIFAETGTAQFNGANETTTITDGNGNVDNGTLIVQRIVTNLNALPNGIVIDVQNNNTSASHTSRGIDIALSTPTGNSTAQANMNAYLGIVQYAGTGGAQLVVGNSLLVGNIGVGSTAGVAGEYLQVENTGGGTNTLTQGMVVKQPIGATAALTSIWTSLYGLEIEDQKPTGAGTNTLTNPPIALLIDSQTASGAYAIKQNGSGLNLLSGNSFEAGSFQIGSATAATTSAGELDFAKISASGTAPTAGNLKISAVAGTNAGTCKLIAYAGTSNTPVTIVDNVGGGC